MENNNYIFQVNSISDFPMAGFIFNSSDQLDKDQKKVVTAAQSAIETSYSPYSKFAVGAAILLEDGKIIVGSNQENMAYPSGICAERAALFAYGSQGVSTKIIKLAVLAINHQNEKITVSAPCGACRQVMLEYELRQESDFEVIFYHNDKYVISTSAKMLLPFHFNL